MNIIHVLNILSESCNLINKTLVNSKPDLPFSFNTQQASQQDLTSKPEYVPSLRSAPSLTLDVNYFEL